MNKDFRKVNFMNFQKWTISRRLMDALRATQGKNSFQNKNIVLKLHFVNLWRPAQTFLNLNLNML